MDPTNFDTLTRSLRRTPSRRITLRAVLGGLTLGAAGWLVAPTASRAKKKPRKTKRARGLECPSPPPAPVSFCKGKNYCAPDHLTSDFVCNSDNSCFCALRADTATTFCGAIFSPFDPRSCAECESDGRVCVLQGGRCGQGFACAEPCEEKPS